MRASAHTVYAYGGREGTRYLGRVHFFLTGSKNYTDGKTPGGKRQPRQPKSTTSLAGSLTSNHIMVFLRLDRDNAAQSFFLWHVVTFLESFPEPSVSSLW